jgi:hypothetical protein
MPLRGCPIVDEDLLAEKYHVCFQLFMSSPNLYLRLYRLFIATSAVIALRSLAGGNSGKKGGFPTKSKKTLVLAVSILALTLVSDGSVTLQTCYKKSQTKEVISLWPSKKEKLFNSTAKSWNTYEKSCERQ